LFTEIEELSGGKKVGSFYRSCGSGRRGGRRRKCQRERRGGGGLRSGGGGYERTSTW